MKKTVYIAPSTFITKVAMEKMIAESNLGFNNTTSASQERGMDAKESQPSYNVWDDDWSK